jgi:hypothetical protein
MKFLLLNLKMFLQRIMFNACTARLTTLFLLGTTQFLVSELLMRDELEMMQKDTAVP